MQAVRVYHQQVCSLPYGASRSLQTGVALHSQSGNLCAGSDCCLVWQSFVCCLPQPVTTKVSFTSFSLVTAEGWWVALVLQSVCLSIPTCLSQPKLSVAARTNLSGRWGAGFLHVTWGTPRQHNLWPTMQCVWTLWNPNGKSMQHHAWPRFSEESLCILPVCVYLLPGSFRRTLHLLFIPWNKAGPWREHRLHTQTHSLSHTHKWASFCYWKVGNYGERGEGQLGFAYVVERRNYISHKARRWKWTSCPWFVDQIPSSWLRNHRIIRTKKLWATLFVPPLLFPRTEVILLPLPPSCLPCANVWCTVLHLFSFSHRKSEGCSPAPPKLSCELPPFV